MTHIKFKPWVGNRYERSKFGRRVMVLGESHYCGDPREADSEITRRVMGWLLDPTVEFDGWMNTFTKFAEAMEGRKMTREESRETWQHVMFYNFVQSPMSETRKSPTDEQFDQSAEAFFEVLEQYKPDVVLAWGSRLYEHLPNAGHKGTDCLGHETWEYQLKGGKVCRVLATYHPSAPMFSPQEWHEAIATFLS